MEKDLFQINLEKISFADVENFTGFNSPENVRPKEGVRIDYKVSIPDDLGDTVTAFSNTFGGIILIGVKADKEKQNIPTEITGTVGNKDIKTTITNKILSTVYPRPSFSIGVTEHNTKPGHVVVVIRVDESNFCPHMYIAQQKNKVSVRIEDENRYASLQEIESLYEKRKRYSQLNLSFQV